MTSAGLISSLMIQRRLQDHIVRLNCRYLYGSVRCNSWTFWTFLLAGRVLVVEEGGVQDTELALEGAPGPPWSSSGGWMGGDWAGVLADLTSSLSLL